MDRSKFANNFWKGSPKEDSCEIISKSDQRFRRRFFKNFFMSICCKKPPFTRTMFMDGSKFRKQFWKGSPKEHSCEIISKSDQQFRRRTFFKNYLKISISLPWQPEFLMESNSIKNFWRGPPKEHSCQVWSKLAQRFGRRRCSKKLLTTHDRHLTTLKAPLEHVVLRWAKNCRPYNPHLLGVFGQCEFSVLKRDYSFACI